MQSHGVNLAKNLQLGQQAVMGKLDRVLNGELVEFSLVLWAEV